MRESENGEIQQKVPLPSLIWVRPRLRILRSKGSLSSVVRLSVVGVSVQGQSEGLTRTQQNRNGIE